MFIYSYITVLILSNIYMDFNKEKALTLHTPFGDSLQVNIIEKEYVANYKEQAVALHREIPKLLRKIKVYKLKDLSLLMLLTKNNYAIQFKNEKDYNKIDNPEHPSWFSLLREKDRFYYSFKPSSKFIEQKLKEPYRLILKSTLKKRDEGTIDSKIIIFKDGSIIKYFKRGNHLYQGNWFYNKEQFLYYWDNDFA